jgi:hypothetical protein
MFFSFFYGLNEADQKVYGRNLSMRLRQLPEPVGYRSGPWQDAPASAASVARTIAGYRVPAMYSNQKRQVHRLDTKIDRDWIWERDSEPNIDNLNYSYSEDITNNHTYRETTRNSKSETEPKHQNVNDQQRLDQ